jgi:hypothetical protein
MGVAVIESCFGFVFAALFLFWVYGVIHGGGGWDCGRNVPPYATHNVLLAAFTGFTGVPVGIFMVLSPICAWRRSGPIHYVLTNRRAIV